MPRIVRLHPPTCSCLVEIEISDDESNPRHDFLLLNRVCDKHKSLVSKTKKPEHDKLSKHVMDLIEEAKTKNLKQVDDMISATTDPLTLNDLVQCRQIVVTKNERTSQEWPNLTAQTHAYDKHIYDQIMSEIAALPPE